MKKSDTAEKIIKNLGGAANINSFTHCATRLRFDIKDKEKINQEDIKSLKEVMGAVDKGGQYQLIIGPAVETLYNEIVSIMGGENTESQKANGEKDTKEKLKEKNSSEKKEGTFNLIVSYISGSIQPTLPVLIGAGMVNAVLAIAVLLGLDPAGGTYNVWSVIAGVGFTYLPVFVAFSAARKLKTNEYVAAFLALAMIVCFNQKEGLTFFNLGVPNVKYANSIIPALLMVPFQLLVDKMCTKFIPAAAHFTVKPLVLTVFTAPVILFIFGPIGAFIGGTLANICIWLMNSVGSLSMAFLSGFHAITVMFGVHYLFTPIMANEVAETGYTFVLCRALAANFAMAGAALAVGFKAKKLENKSIGFSSGVTALLSVTEPALYGCLVRLRKPLVTSCIAAAISGIFIGIFQVKAYAIASPCVLSMPIFIGGDSMMNFILACAAALIAFVLGFILTYIVGFKED